jgi:hypothetical protein
MMLYNTVNFFHYFYFSLAGLMTNVGRSSAKAQLPCGTAPVVGIAALVREEGKPDDVCHTTPAYSQ